ncbi:hypothetical protein, partial [Enterocloster lavalensis]|uniref:hypothetical protein n=1 Tax=Enterocloster lavalensis TaxID=460384 RepID=UPI0023EFED96
VPHNNTPSTGCPVKGVHIISADLRFLYPADFIKKLAKLDKKDQKNIRKGVDKLSDLYYINISNNYYY